MKIKSIKNFRWHYKTQVRKRNDRNTNTNFVGVYHDEGNKRTNGYFELTHGDKKIHKFLPSILKIAEDGQAIYEFIQNAVDCGSSQFFIFYNDKYFLAVNNGKPFNHKDVLSILNIADTTKDYSCDNIGRFGIGFKLVHRLVGKDEGIKELIEDYKGPVIFSWNNLGELKQLLGNSPVFPNFVKNPKNIDDITGPWLFKIIATNFPTEPGEKVLDINYKETVLFPYSELKEIIDYLKENFKTHQGRFDFENLEQGSLFFLKLGEGKRALLDNDYKGLESGVQYSMNFLKNLKEVYINENSLKKSDLVIKSFEIKKESELFNEINPEYSNCDIKIALGFTDYKKAEGIRKSPNFYKYFPMGDETNGFSFIIHCDSFDIEANRRKLHDSNKNRKLFPQISNFITQYAEEKKESNRNEFLNFYANILVSRIPVEDNNKWLYDIFFEKLLIYIQSNIPVKGGYSNNSQNVKINKLKSQLKLADFGLGHIQWFEWDNDADRLLINEAIKSEKLGIEEWDIRNIIENADIDSINNWIANCEEPAYNDFLNELEESYLRVETKESIRNIKLFKFSNGKFYSLNEVIKKDNYGKPIFKFTNCFFSNNKTKGVKNELTKLGLVVSELSVEDYPIIFSTVTLPDDRKHYDLIAKWCIENGNKLLANEKKKLFLNFINEATKFDNVSEVTLKDLHLFCESNSEIKPLNKLIDCNLNTASWLNAYKIKKDEFFAELEPYLVSEQEEIFEEIFIPNQDLILSELTEENEIKSLVKLYHDNQKPFFKEYIIKKTESGFLLVRKTNNSYQVRPSNKEVRLFIKQNFEDTLLALPFEFDEECKDEVSIVRGEELYELILSKINVNDFKEQLVDVIHYDEPKRKFLKDLSEFKFNSETRYTKEDFEFKILNLACNVLNERDFSEFRNSVVIETSESIFKLSDIAMFSDKINISNKEFSLSKILPSTHQNSDLISDLISQFNGLGIPNEKLNILFGVNEELDTDGVFQKFIEQTEALENQEQFFFLVYYHQENPGSDILKLGFDLNHAVFPSEYALENEKLPEYLQKWINNEEIKLSELEKLGIWTENTVLVELRKFLKGDINAFSNIRLAQDTRFNEDETMLFNTFEWLKEKGIKLSTPEQFESFKKIVDIINESRKSKGNLIIEEEYNFELLKENSTIWQEIENFTILLYDDQVPLLVGLDEIKEYIFYSYMNGDYAVNNNIIYINSKKDKMQTLLKVASDDKNEFSSKELLELFGERNENENEEDQDTNTSFLDEVNQFITEELEATEWSDYIPDLKNLLQDFNNHPQEKQKLFNLIAKIKLTKERNIKYEDSDEGFNIVKIGSEKFFVHSARGAFAYIHPNEILKMINEGYKMALDFNTKSRIKIYDKAEDILELNTNHILAFQGAKPFEDLIAFCEANRGEKKHLLIIDKDNANEKSKAYLKLFNNSEDDYQ
ncbi:sacsin N-terminal ATP-binding-like domain-containing protein [Tamlana crocina]|uniref:ATP-binding protein n=1 Tax=Tamlana crocina TaxID=393006 RepID=A0ABX1DFV4_9FLAO|nr:hypothetical protein [Tamlana crocina]NJX15523.1 hypothetical protein [Tamlana crocina]